MSKNINTSKRKVVYQKTMGHCAYCGIKLDPFSFVVEHVVSRKWGGTNSLKNLLPSCTSCNSLKRDHTLREFKKRLVSLEGVRKEIEKVKERFHKFRSCFGGDLRMHDVLLKTIEDTIIPIIEYPTFYFERFPGLKEDVFESETESIKQWNERISKMEAE